MPTLWLPPKTWFHGSQSTSTGGSSARKAMHWRIICWLAHHMRWVVITPLGALVEPEVKRNLAIVSAPTCGMRGVQRRAGRVCEQARERARRAAFERAFGQHHRHVRRHRGLDRLRVGGRAGEHQARRGRGEDVAQLAVVLRDQRVGRRDRHVGHAGPQRAQRQREVLEVVVGQDRPPAARPTGRGRPAPGRPPARAAASAA